MEKPDKKIFTALFFSLFASVTGVGIVVPLLPVYAHGLGGSGLYIALIFGGFSISRTFFIPWFGRLSDQKGRKPFLTTGLFAYFLISIAFMFAKDLNTLIGIRIVQGVASAMIMPVAQAYIGDITPSGSEGFSMGLFNISIFLGLSIGPLVGGFINEYFSLQAAFACMGVFALIAFCLSLFYLPPARSERIVERGGPSVAWRTLLTDRIIMSLFAFRLVYTTCIGMIWGFLPVYADSAFSLSSVSIGVLVVLGISISGILHVPMGALADKVDKRVMVITGGLIIMLANLLIGLADGFWGLFVANVIFGIGGGISMPPLMAMAIISGNKSGAMGSVMSIIVVAHSLGMLCGSFIGGIVMDLFQLRFAFPMGGLIMLLGIFLFILGTNKRLYQTN